MDSKNIKQVALLLANMNFGRMASVYGFTSDEMVIKAGYIQSKLNEAIKHPVRWLNSLDQWNLQHFANLANTMK